jgi:hypothetical protein
MHVASVAISVLGTMMWPVVVLASQGPGVTPGTASGFAQGCAAGIVFGLGVVALVGVARYFFGWSPLPEK